MQIIEVKNNLVRISYDASDRLVLSGFIVIKDSTQSFIAQIIHLEANQYGSYAVLKLLFTFDDNGVISNYNGSIPDVKSFMDVVQPNELLELLPVQDPIFLGELAQQKTLLNLDRKFLEEKLLICSEKQDDNELLVKNLAHQLVNAGKKVLVIDLGGTFESSEKKIVGARNFKLPLNYETINFIYEKGLDDAKVETKALIQDIFLEVQNYVKTLPQKFIPFESFKDVVDGQYEELGIVELVLLKNKLLKYYEAGIFAQNRVEFDSLEFSLNTSPLTVFDLSKVEEKVQREMISYVYSLISKLKQEIYVIVNVNDANSDKKLVKQIFTTKNAFSSIICSYSYKYLKELKQLSRNIILFAPIQQQDDFAGYGVFLSKLNPHEFIVYGSLTHHLPLIVRQEAYSKYFDEQKSSSESAHEMPLEEEPEESLDEKINDDLNNIIYTTPKSEIQQTKEVENSTYVEDDLTEEDLDLLDDFSEPEIQEDDGQIPDNITFNLPPVVEEPEVVDFESITEDESEVTEEVPIEIDISEDEELQNELVKDESQVSFTDIMSEQIENSLPPEPPSIDILPAKMSSTPIVPIYSADIEPKVQSDEIEQGDVVVHPKYGKGTVEKLITYGSKTLCSINFDNVGRRLLDPTLAEIKKSE